MFFLVRLCLLGVIILGFESAVVAPEIKKEAKKHTVAKASVDTTSQNTVQKTAAHKPRRHVHQFQKEKLISYHSKTQLRWTEIK